jgi:EAL domain-containing protein (putative c-di-GMP-specific phosphodiesterase class I)
VKIDGVFVRDIATNPGDYAVVRSIIEIGHYMGKKTIAEFVENDDILKNLREIGVDYAQGYAIERPHALNDL